jgi:NAD-dependent deacetylase
MLRDAALRDLLDIALAAPAGPVVVLTGAGISAESGVPTFRGPEGYWTVGSRNYRPEELTTFEAFARMPEDIWSWYLYRRSVCRAAEPNGAHHALVELETALGDDFLLITQNVDGLHLRAGNSAARTYQVHGSLDRVRCAAECNDRIDPLPAMIDAHWERGRPLDASTAGHLRCTGCGGWLRPHVLWFDEYYDETHFRFDSSLRATLAARLLIVVGTSGSTNLPDQICRLAHQRGTPMVVINRETSPFSALAESSPAGHFARASATAVIPTIATHLIAGASR